MQASLKASGLAIAAVLGAGLLAAQAQSGRPLTVVSWGGAYQEAQKKVYFEPFEAASGKGMIDPTSLPSPVNSNDVT